MKHPDVSGEHVALCKCSCGFGQLSHATGSIWNSGSYEQEKAACHFTRNDVNVHADFTIDMSMKLNADVSRWNSMGE